MKFTIIILFIALLVVVKAIPPVKIITTTTTTSISTDAIPMKITTTTKTITQKICPTTGLNGVLSLECTRKGGKIYIQSDGNCGYLYVCLLPCDLNTTVKTLPISYSKTLPKAKTLPVLYPGILPTNTNKSGSELQIEGKSYCSCEIFVDTKNVRISTDMAECEEYAALLTDTPTTPPPKTTTPPSTTITSTRTVNNDEFKRTLKENCLANTGAFFVKDDENGEFEYSCLYPCERTYAKSLSTSKSIPITSSTVATKVDQIQYNKTSYCYCKMLNTSSNSRSTDLNKCNEFINSLNENNTCNPETITVTEKIKETVTKKEIVTVTVTVTDDNQSVSDNQCAKKYEQCGGKGYNGTTCCESGTTCQRVSPYFSHCA